MRGLMRLLGLVLALLSASRGVLATDYMPYHKLVYSPAYNWKLNLMYSSFSIAFSDRIIFNMTSGNTVNVVSPTPSPVCNGLPGTQLFDGTASGGVYIFDPNLYNGGTFAGGTMTFASVPYCSQGVFVTITVGTRFPSASPTVQPTNSPLPGGQTHSPFSKSPTTKAPTPQPTAKPSSSPSTSPTSASRYGQPIQIDFGDGGLPVTLSLGAACLSSDSSCSGGYMVRVLMEYASSGWLGFGVGSTNSNPMIGGHAVAGFVDPGKPGVGLYNLASNNIDSVTLVSGSLESNGIINASFATTADSATLSFNVITNVAKTYLNLIPDPAGGASSASNNIILILAKGGYQSLKFAQHEVPAFSSSPSDPNPINVLVLGALNSGGNTGNGSNPKPYQQPVRVMDNALAAHIILGLFTFGLCLPLGGLIAWCHHRGTKHKIWFRLHFRLQIFGGITAMACWISALVHVNGLTLPNFSNSHEQLGLAVFLGVVFQIGNGLLRPHVPPEAGMEPSFARKIWYTVHRLIASTVLLGGAINILLGPGVFRGVFLGAANYYSIAGYVYTGQNLVYFIYAVGGVAIGVIALGAIYGTFLRHRPEWQHQYNRPPDHHAGHDKVGTASG